MGLGAATTTTAIVMAGTATAEAVTILAVAKIGTVTAARAIVVPDSLTSSLILSD
jgi:hypothetical protein